MMTISAILAFASSLLPQSQMEIAIRVAGGGAPSCRAYQIDGTEGPCLPVFSVRRGNSVNGWSIGSHITFSSAATTRLNQNEFALLAGHEIAHYYLGHTHPSLEAELAADKFGAELACKAGFDPIAGASMFRHLRSSKVHPKHKRRHDLIINISCETAVNDNLPT